MLQKVVALISTAMAFVYWATWEALKSLVVDQWVQVINPSNPVVIEYFLHWLPPAVFAAAALYLLLPPLNKSKTGSHMLSVIIMIFGAAMFVGGALLYRIENGHFPLVESKAEKGEREKPAVVQAPVVNVPLLEHQLKQIDDIESFIGNKDESDLRSVFDFDNVLKFNIKIIQRGILGDKFPKEDSSEIDKVFKGGQARLDMRFCKIVNVNHSARVDLIPGKVGLINITSKYVEARKHLLQLAASPKLTNEIVAVLNEMNDAVEYNSVLLLEVLNEKFSENTQNILKEFDPTTNYFGGTSGMYWSKFRHLRPIADKLNTEIKGHLMGRN